MVCDAIIMRLATEIKAPTGQRKIAHATLTCLSVMTSEDLPQEVHDMSGHSKWATIQHKKGLADAKRGQMFTKLIKEISVAAKMGGSDPESNARLRTAILKARADNMPKDNIERAIKERCGEMEGSTYYDTDLRKLCPGGCGADHRYPDGQQEQDAADVRTHADKLGGSLGTSGSVAYMFQSKGVITYDGETYSEDQILEAALELGAEDISTSDGVIEVVTDPGDFNAVLEGMQVAGFTESSAEVSKIADTTVSLDHEKIRKVLKIIERLEEIDDVQLVSSNLDIPDDFNDEEE